MNFAGKKVDLTEIQSYGKIFRMFT